ncbi:MAG: hypothetical protein AB7I50_02325 [Vicinamibacterales bacterium]
MGSVRLAMVVGLVLVGATASGCDERLSDITGPTPDLQPTFSSIQKEILLSTAQTACSNCHNAVNARFAGNLDLSGDGAYAALVNAASRNKAGAVRVVPGGPDNSYLIQKLEGRTGIFGLRMPQNGPPYLTEGQLLVIRKWILDGAERN